MQLYIEVKVNAAVFKHAILFNNMCIISVHIYFSVAKVFPICIVQLFSSYDTAALRFLLHRVIKVKTQQVWSWQSFILYFLLH